MESQPQTESSGKARPTRHDWPPRALRSNKKQSPTALARATSYMRQLWSNGIIFQAVGIPLRHLLAFYGLRLCLSGQVPWRTGLLALALWPISGFGVTAGVHRLWTHQSYVASPMLEAMLMLMFSMADQGPIQGWALTHAMHHVASDTRCDPHDRNAGFWYAHVGWLFSATKFRLATREYRRVVENFGPTVKFHDACSLWWDPLWSHGVPAALAALWGDVRGGLFVAGALRWMIVQHITFAVNSLAHGEQDGNAYAFDPKAFGIGPKVSVLVSLLALGEGWHDYHHLFPWDYAAAELDAWDQYNPTKVFIDGCCLLGLAKDRRRCSRRLQDLRRSQLLAGSVEGEELEFEVVGLPFLRYKRPLSLMPRETK
ncbi:D11DS [Symbiodinium natans]|uniref:D11DS protein n=1 Tax=Symbiodinium natans TaxID=878477 RepID=A0A812QVF7_9DINO|nr:D11DS [Symbiodinium natans]